MLDRRTESQRAPPGQPEVVLKHQISSVGLGEVRFEILDDVVAVGYPHVVVVGWVVHSIVGERNEQTSVDRLLERDLVDHVVIADGEDVFVVHSERSRGEAQQEPRSEVIDHSAVAVGGCVVEFVYDDIVKVVGSEDLEMFRTAEGLHCGEEHASAVVLPLAGV
ncbi:MAG: hypothetical protein BWY85_01942 [Firmicutes bacterium ADurb.Bin506]|nr:MAG: hypothetical protein BWY85_01942 [Firmicutes bacterium ADurb.Bin506]